jgi:hypothetical protein
MLSKLNLYAEEFPFLRGIINSGAATGGRVFLFSPGRKTRPGAEKGTGKLVM